MPETQGSEGLPGILARIVASKADEVAALRLRASEIEDALASAPPPRDFRAALDRPDTVRLIAECKRRSPGAGPIRPGLEPAGLAGAYERAGAAALSVLTDGPYFGGSNEDLAAAREAVSIPVLRKDFTLDPLQVLEARGAGADAVLLIVRILRDDQLDRLHREASALGMSVLVETHDRRELERAVRVGARIIGINNRDLATFDTDLDTTLRLLEEVPAETVVVSESGIRDAADVRVLGEAGVHAILVGESLLRAPDPAAKAAELAAVARVGRVAG